MAVRQRKKATGTNKQSKINDAVNIDRKATDVARIREGKSNLNEDQHGIANRASRSSDWKIRLLGWLFVGVVVLVSKRDAIFNEMLPYIYLQHPEVVNRFLPQAWHFRLPLAAPGDGGADLRQVLIVGTMSSGTRQVVSDLQRRLNLEISHEASDASHFLVRDGTVSWFHGIRFLKDVKSDPEIQDFCRHPTPLVGFHPRFYNYSACDVSQQWSPCWASECERILRKEWGCARRRLPSSSEDERGATTNSECTMFQTFHTTLHQVRNPIHTIESLIAKFCGNDDASRGSGFGKVYKFLFPDDKEGHSSPRLTRWEVVSQYVVNYSRAMLEAEQNGLINATYSIETTSVCKVAELAGFRTTETVVYEPNLNKIQARCNNTKNSEAMTPKTKFKVNKGQVKIVWSDLLGGRHGSQKPLNDRSLVEEIQALMIDLGYDPNEIPEMR